MDMRHLSWAVNTLSQDPAFEAGPVKDTLATCTMYACDENMSFNPPELFARLRAGEDSFKENCMALLQGGQGHASSARDAVKMIVMLKALANLMKHTYPRLKEQLAPQSNAILESISRSSLKKLQFVADKINEQVNPPTIH